MELQSQITGRPTSQAHYITEIAILRQAKKKKVKLYDGFWNDRVWKKEYQSQLMAAHALLKVFDFIDIVKALNSKDADWVYSLRYKGLIEVINSIKEKRERQEAAVAKKAESAIQEVTEKVEVKVSIPQKGNSLSSKLRD